MRVFVDTNIVISSMLFPNGKVAKVFSHLLEKHTVIIYNIIIRDKTTFFGDFYNGRTKDTFQRIKLFTETSIYMGLL